MFPSFTAFSFSLQIPSGSLHSIFLKNPTTLILAFRRKNRYIIASSSKNITVHAFPYVPILIVNHIFRPGHVLSINLLVAALAMLLSTLVTDFGLFCLLVALSGAAQAPLWPACIKVITYHVEPSSFGILVGLLGTAPYAGATFRDGPCSTCHYWVKKGTGKYLGPIWLGQQASGQAKTFYFT